MKYSEFRRRIMVTGGAGFIGSNLLPYMIDKYPEYLFVNVDCLTYAGNLANLASIEKAPNYRFEKTDICDFEPLSRCFAKYDIDAVIHLAAESHVDRSIIGPASFVNSNIIGTFHLLELARNVSGGGRKFRFHHVSTDEVFGSAAEGSRFTEDSPYRPSSPYSASKAAGDHLVRACHLTYGLDVVTVNSCNNYGPYQFPEKLIPLMIRNALAGLPLPVYGDGRHVRDWLFVRDHCEAIDLVFHKGRSGQTYNISGHTEIENIEMVRLLCAILSRELGCQPLDKLITFVKDRPGHDRHYALDASRIASELGWKAKYRLEEGLEMTVRWYLDHEQWLQSCINGQYLRYYEQVYGDRV
jgi:dTDP-glucose 4,6-dehydratase